MGIAWGVLWGCVAIFLEGWICGGSKIVGHPSQPGGQIPHLCKLYVFLLWVSGGGIQPGGSTILDYILPLYLAVTVVKILFVILQKSQRVWLWSWNLNDATRKYQCVLFPRGHPQSARGAAFYISSFTTNISMATELEFNESASKIW